MRVTDLLALSHVPRWTIIPHTVPQSVGDHTFRVLVIALDLIARLPIKEGPVERCLNTGDLMLAILYHDADESRTGDIPTPVKERTGVAAPTDACPWLAVYDTYPGLPKSLQLVLDLADKIEALTFIRRYGIGSHAVRAADSMRRKIEEVCPEEWRRTVDILIADIDTDRGR